MRILSLSLLVLALAGCQSMPAPTVSATPVPNADALVKAADWSKIETVTVVLGEHHFTPTDLKLKAGQAYKLELRNDGEKDHYFTSVEFFKNVAWRKVMVNKQAEIKAPYFLAFEPLKKGGQVDLYFVAVNKGTYQVICTIDDHREKGMEATVVIE